jgi:hypothetical protein
VPIAGRSDPRVSVPDDGWCRRAKGAKDVIPDRQPDDRDRRRSKPDPARVSNIANPEVVMRPAHRLVLALLIVVMDTAAFAVPLASLLLAYVLLARPVWFRDWVERLYCGVPR